MALMDKLNTSTKILEGDGQHPDEICAFEICKRVKANPEDNKCKYIDIENRCTYDHCVWEENESPMLTKKWWTKCVICDQEFTRDPRDMRVPFCDSCLERIHKAEKLPFTCICCGNKQNHPSLIMFSGICDYCVKFKLFNTTCKKFEMTRNSTVGTGGVANYESV